MPFFGLAFWGSLATSASRGTSKNVVQEVGISTKTLIVVIAFVVLPVTSQSCWLNDKMHEIDEHWACCQIIIRLASGWDGTDRDHRGKILERSVCIAGIFDCILALVQRHGAAREVLKAIGSPVERDTTVNLGGNQMKTYGYGN